jgi:DNA-binding NarL/FixJ family response regulator
MPEMNGMEMYREILSTRPEMTGRFIFITGDLIDREVTEFLEETCAPTVPKPLNIDALKEIVARALDPGGATTAPVR